MSTQQLLWRAVLSLCLSSQPHSDPLDLGRVNCWRLGEVGWGGWVTGSGVGSPKLVLRTMLVAPHDSVYRD